MKGAYLIDFYYGYDNLIYSNIFVKELINLSIFSWYCS